MLASDFRSFEAVWLDLDERSNRLVLAVSPTSVGQARSTLSRDLVRLGIPLTALEVISARKAQPDVGTGRSGARTAGTSQLLSDGFAMVQGGIELSYWDGVSKPCTLGIVLDSAGVRRATTNSHCTASSWRVDGRNFFQPVATPDPSYRIGFEVADPTGYACSFFGQPKECRESDLAMLTLVAGQASGRGYIARTTWANRTYAMGSQEIDAVNPYFFVTTAGGTIIQGMQVHKIGAMSGWTYGVVTRSCVTEFDGARGAGSLGVCDHVTDYYRLGGDSGAPVFTWAGGDAVTLVGIHHGGSLQGESNPFGIFSGWDGIKRDFGAGANGALNPLIDVVLGPVVAQGSLSGSLNPMIAWAAPSAQNAIRATKYAVYRMVRPSSQDYDGPWELVLSTSTSLSFDDVDVDGSSYAGSTRPPTGTGYVAYYVLATNSGLESRSQTIYFIGGLAQ